MRYVVVETDNIYEICNKEKAKYITMGSYRNCRIVSDSTVDFIFRQDRISVFVYLPVCFMDGNYTKSRIFNGYPINGFMSAWRNRFNASGVGLR